MNGWTYACLAVGLLFLAAPAGALIPDDVKIITSGEWLTAGSGETATVTVLVTNGTPATPVVGAAVYLAVDDDEYGSISRTYVVTGDDGKATAIFRHGTRSGTATITATVAREGMEPLTDSGEQKIDHATAHKVANLWYEPEVTAGAETNITVRMVDKYGNVVDGRNVAEKVTFMVGSPAGFIGGTDEITVPVDAAGNATATLRVDTVAGQNIVHVTFPGNIGPRSLIVTGLANAEPSKIYQSISPKVEDPNPDYYPELPLGEQFTITYALYDEYDNPAGDRQIRVNIQPISGFLNSEELFTRTNSMGKAQITYTSLDRVGVAEIVATAVDNSSVSCTQKVGFYSADPTGMVLTAVPQTIASRDVKDDIVSSVRAKVMDSKGNPVQSQSVWFRITDVDDGGYAMTREPEISNGVSTSRENGTALVAMTDMDGFATIDFHPGAFTRIISDPLYSDMASGGATIQAEWEGKTEDTIVSFRNYPYLSVNVTVEPQVVAVNSSVNVTIQLIGDGWALQMKPVDVVLCTDRSGSMLQNTTYGGGSTYSPNWVEQESIDDRMVHAMRAAKIFVSQMQSSKDRIGLVSFGQSEWADLDTYGYKHWVGNDYKWVWHEGYWWQKGYWGWESDSSDDDDYIEDNYKNPQYYSGPATRDLELTRTYTDVNATIDKWLPCGGTPMREGLYQSVKMILDNRKTGADPVEAIVLLTDGEYSEKQNPEGGRNEVSLDGIGTGSVIDYAKSKDIKIFTIALGSEPSHDALKSYANKTGGTFYSATAGDDLTQVYADIATKLQEAASVNTTMDLAFDRVEINSTPVEDVFEYEPSTEMSKYWTGNGTTIWKLEPPKDLSDDWEEDQTLTFEVGDIYLDQTWETMFRLKVLKEGNIDIFGNDSVIKFNGTAGPTELRLPHTFITASHNLSESGAAAAQIWLTQESLNTDEPGILVPTWGLNYTGNQSVTQKIMYQFSQDDIWWDGNWHEADTLHHPADTNVNGTYSTTLNLGEKEGWYKIRVFAQEITPDDDGATNEITWADSVLVGAGNRAYIKIS